MARRIAFGAGAAAAFFMPLRIARIAFAILKRKVAGRLAAVASSLAEISLEAKSHNLLASYLLQTNSPTNSVLILQTATKLHTQAVIPGLG